MNRLTKLLIVRFGTSDVYGNMDLDWKVIRYFFFTEEIFISLKIRAHYNDKGTS